MNKLRAYMDKYNLDPSAVAAICGVQVSAVYAWLSKGQTQPMSNASERVFVLSMRLYDLTGKWPE